MTNKIKPQMEAKNLEDLNLYIEKIIGYIKNQRINSEVRENYINRTLNVYLKENDDYIYAVEQICHRVKLADSRYKQREGDFVRERQLKNQLRKYLFELVKTRGHIRGTRFFVFIKEKQTICKKLIFKCKKEDIPEEFLKDDGAINYPKIKYMLRDKGEQKWVKYDPEHLYSLWITKPDYDSWKHKYDYRE